MKKLFLLFSVTSVLSVSSVLPSFAVLKVVTTTTDLAAIAREIGGDKVTVESLAKGVQNPHFVDAKPSLIVKLMKADAFVQVGMELEIGWVPPLVQGSRNPKIQPGAPGNIDASKGVAVLELPTGSVSRSEGDVHPYGNPHYWLDPANGGRVAANLRDAFTKLAPEDAAYFKERDEAFQRRLKESIAGWSKRGAELGLKGLPVVTYHRSWSYFVSFFGMDVVGFVEPKPGIPPSPRHIHELEHTISERKARVIIVEPYYDIKLPSKVAAETGAQLVVIGPSVGAEKDVADYFGLFDRALEHLAASLKGGSDVQP